MMQQYVAQGMDDHHRLTSGMLQQARRSADGKHEERIQARPSVQDAKSLERRQSISSNESQANRDINRIQRRESIPRGNASVRLTKDRPMTPIRATMTQAWQRKEQAPNLAKQGAKLKRSPVPSPSEMDPHSNYGRLLKVQGTMEEKMCQVKSNLTMLSMSLDRTTKRMQSIMLLQLAQQRHLLEQQQLLAVLQEEYFASKDQELRDILDPKQAAGKGDNEACFRGALDPKQATGIVADEASYQEALDTKQVTGKEDEANNPIDHNTDTLVNDPTTDAAAKAGF